MAKQESFKVKQKIDAISIKPSQYGGNHYKIITTQGEQFSTFDKTAGDQITGIGEGDIVEVEYFVNPKGFKTFISLKLVDNDKGLQQEFPTQETPINKETTSPLQKRSVDRLDKNCISAGNMAVELMGLLDFSKMNEEGIVEKFKALWEIIKEEING